MTVVPVIFATLIPGLGVASVRPAIRILSFPLALFLGREKDLYDA